MTMNYLPRLIICLNNTLIIMTALHHFYQDYQISTDTPQIINKYYLSHCTLFLYQIAPVQLLWFTNLVVRVNLYEIKWSEALAHGLSAKTECRY